MKVFTAGGVYKENTELIRKLGIAQLLSQIERKNIMDGVEYKRANPDCKCEFMIDSGAFTTYTKGKEVDVDDYVNFMNEIDDVVDWYIQVDKIPGKWGMDRNCKEFQEDAILAPKISGDNYLYMRSKAVSPHKLLPVYHQGEDIKWLENMLEGKDENGNHIGFICISTSKDMSKTSNLQWLAEVWSCIYRSSNPKVKVHALGLMQLKTLKLYPFYSSDSTSWIQTAANGGVMTPAGTYLFSNRQIGNVKDHAEHDTEDAKLNLDEFITDLGFTRNQLMEETPINRLNFNLTFLNKWQTGFYDEKWYPKIRKQEMFTKKLF